MKNLFALIIVLVFLSSCNQAEKKTSENESANNEAVAKLLTVEQVLEAPENYNGADVKITGMVTHVCKHGGQKLFIIGDDPELQLRVNVGKEIPEFDVALEGSTVEFTGKVVILEPEVTEALTIENEEKAHHTGDEPHAKAESAAYCIEATAFKEIASEI